MSGVQAQLSRELTKRPDTKAEFERYIEPYFYNAADLSYDTLAISFPWSAFEYAKDIPIFFKKTNN